MDYSLKSARSSIAGLILKFVIMKYKYILLFLFLFNSLLIKAQPDYPVESIRFANFTPDWVHISVDSASIIPGEYNGSSLLAPIQTIKYYLLLTRKNYYYNLLQEFKYLSGNRGWFLEKINMDNGQVEESHRLVMGDNTDQYFYPRYSYFDEDQNPCVLSYKPVNKEDYGKFGQFGAPSHLATHRIIDGSLIPDYPEDSDTTAFRFYANFFDDYDWFFDEGDGRISLVIGKRVRYFLNDSTSRITPGFQRIILDEHGYAIDTSEIVLHREHPEDGAVQPLFGEVYKLPNGNYVIGASVYTWDERLCSSEVIYLDKNFKVIQRFDMLPVMGISGDATTYRPTMAILRADDEDFKVVNGFTIDTTVKFGFATRIKTLDYSGNVKESIDTVTDGQGNYYWFYHVIKQDHRLWLFSINPERGKRKSTDILSTDGRGHISLVKRLWALDSSKFIVPYSVKMVSKNKLLIKGNLFKEEKDRNGNKKHWPVVLLMDTDKLGLTNGSRDVTADSEDYLLFPNTATDKLFLKFDDKLRGYVEISDIYGRSMGQYRIDDRKEMEIDIRNLSGGSYQLRVVPHAKHKRYTTKKFIKR